MKKKTAAAAPEAIALDSLPGYAIRKLQQIAVAIFLQEAEAHGITPVQSTTAGVVDRLETRGLMLRSASEQDRRVRLLTLTEEGRALLREVVPAMQQAQRRILEPLNAKEQAQFMALLMRIVEGNGEHSRAPGLGKG